MATYTFKSTEELAQFLRVRAVQLNEHEQRQIKQGASARAIRETVIAKNAWLTAAEIVRDSKIEQQ